VRSAFRAVSAAPDSVRFLSACPAHAPSRPAGARAG
jgi:hypothetical protein